MNVIRKVLMVAIGALAAVVGALIFFGGAPAEAAGACSIYWTGATNSAWETPTNWSATDGGVSADRIPTDSDVVCMSTAPVGSTVVLGTSITVASIRFPATPSVQPALSVTSGTLTIGSSADGAFDSIVNNLALARRTTLAGTAAVTATGRGTTLAGVTLSGTGVLTLGPDTVVRTENSGFSLQAGRRLVNQGDLSVLSGNPWIDPTVVVTLSDGAVLENAGLMTVAGGDTEVLDSGGIGDNRLINDRGATMTVGYETDADDGYSSSVSINVPLTNQGTFRSAFGGVYLVNGSSGGGRYATSSHASLGVYGPFSLNGASFRGSGYVYVHGLVTGSATIRHVGFFGATLDGTGTLTIPSYGKGTLGTVSLDHGYRILNKGKLNTVLTSETGRIDMSNSSTIENSGAMSVYSQDGYSLQIVNNDSTSSQLLNDVGATLYVYGSSTHVEVGVTLTNQGTVSTGAGDLYLEGGGLGGGRYDTALDATLHAAGGALSLAGASFTGSGQFAIDGGTVRGSATIAHIAFDGGILDGAGTLTIPASGTGSLRSTVSLAHGYRILNYGTVATPLDDADHHIYLSNASTIENAGTMTLSSSNGHIVDLIDRDGSANTVINDVGATLVAAGADNTSSALISPTVTNAGTLLAQAGVLSINRLANLTSAGVLTGGTLQATGGTMIIPTTIVTNNATLDMTSGYIKAGGISAISGLRTNTGTLTLGASRNVGGALDNSGSITLNGGTLLATTYTQSDGVTTVNAGATLKVPKNLALNGGVFTGTGSVISKYLTGVGTLEPGGGAGTLALTGKLVQSSNSKLSIKVSGPSAPGIEFGQATVSGTATVAGTLAINTASGYLPPVGTSYTVLHARSLAGTYNNVTGQDLSNGTYYAVSYSATVIKITVVSSRDCCTIR